jgi:hypothetical protein
LPIKSSLGQKVSNFVGASKLKLNNYVNLEYDFITKNNLTEFNYHNLKSTIRINNFVTKFEFIEENNNIGNESFIANESLLKIIIIVVFYLEQEKIKKPMLRNIMIGYINTRWIVWLRA